MPLYLSGCAFLSLNLETFLLGLVENIFYVAGMEFFFSADVFHGVPKVTHVLLMGFSIFMVFPDQVFPFLYIVFNS